MAKGPNSIKDKADPHDRPDGCEEAELDPLVASTGSGDKHDRPGSSEASDCDQQLAKSSASNRWPTEEV